MAGERIREIRGTPLPLRGDDIDTDRIIPARFLRSVSFDGLQTHLFEDERQHAAHAGRVHPVSDHRYRSASILIVEANFGCGSSREHAPQAIQRRGIRAIVGRSFSEIFFGNATALGLPCVTAPADATAALIELAEREDGVELQLSLETMSLRAGDREFAVDLPATARAALLDGSWDATGVLLEGAPAVAVTAAQLPYVTGIW
ncbi:MAG TPA: 3-isopropylmalate dehydratase small subunit [Vicinamibacterales bacterium]